MTTDIKKLADSVIAATYSRFPIVLTRGSGCTLWDTEDRAYTDFVAGIAVCNLGHAHPEVAQALTEQAKILLHVSNLYYTRPQADLAAWLVENSFADKVFFCNSGAEANEAAIKLARKYGKEKRGKDCFQIIAMEQSFHGRTMAALSATGQEKIRTGFDPILGGFDFVPFNDIDALKEKINDCTCAVLLEPIQGEGGVRCPDGTYLQQVRQLCDEKEVLLIFDEIQTGMGRTGRLFAYEHFHVKPDVMTLAKALANGLPIGAMLAKEEVATAFSPGSHASTFGGTPIITAAALAVVRLLKAGGVIDHGKLTGDYFMEKLLELKDKYDVIQDVRGMGLLLGMKLAVDGVPIVNRCMEAGFLINCIQGNILRFIPPLIIEKNQIDALIACLDRVLADCK